MVTAVCAAPVGVADGPRFPVMVYVMIRWERDLLFLRHGRSAVWDLPKGNLGRGETPVVATERITFTTVGLRAYPGAVALGTVQHQRDTTGGARMALFFEVRRFDGVPA